MNDYDDSEDYSSSNSFRARSNTWPLNRPDLAVPNGVCIDETLPEIELEEDDLFTTNENWSTGLVDHDIMSWDPILNAQGHNNHHHHHHHQQHQQQQQQTTAIGDQQQQTTVIGDQHQHHQAATVHHHHNQPQTQGHQRQRSIHQHHQQPQSHQHHNNHHQQQQQQNETLLSDSTIIIGGQVQQQQPHQHQQAQQLPPQHHQTLNNTHCFDTDDPSDYHVHQHMHHLRLDNNQVSSVQRTHYISSLSPMCIPGSTTALGNDSYISSDHQLQPLTSARYDLDQQNDLDLKAPDDDHQHQLHHLTSSSLDHHSHMLSSSLSTSGIGLSGDLEDLDYKAADPSVILQNPSFEDQHQDQPGGVSSNKQSSSTTSSKTKLNTPRRNAWGNMSYADLISQAINSTNDKRLTLSQIYDWMVQHVPYFKDKGDSNSSAGWKNSVRHNLSLHNRFKRLQNEGTGKSSWWTINPEANIGKCARRRAASMEASKYEKKRGRAKKRAEAIRQGLISYPSLTNSSLNGSTSALEQHPHHQSSSHLRNQEQQQSQQQQSDGLNSDNLHNRQHNTGLFVTSSQETQYEQKDNNMQQQPQTQAQPQQQQAQSQTPCHQQPQAQQPQSDTAPALQVATQQQPKQEQQPTPKRVQQPQVHHQLQKMETHETDSYYIQQHDLQHHDQIHQNQQHQILSNDHMDLFGRHAIYMSEPCNDCNCTELINCGTNAMSFT